MKNLHFSENILTILKSFYTRRKRNMFLRSPSKLVTLYKQIIALGLASSGVLMCLSAKANADTMKAQNITQPEVLLANEATDLKQPEEVVPKTPSVTDTVDPNSTTQADKPPTDTTVPTTPTDETDPTTPTDTSVPTTPTDETDPTTPTDTSVPTTPTDANVPTNPTDETTPTDANVPTNPTDETTPTDATAPEVKSIVETAKSSDSFKTLTKALEAAGLVETLEGKGPFTVFAPTDEAFAALPKETLDKLMMPENKEQLIKVLTYHVVSGTISFKGITETQKGQVPTVEGTSLDIVASSNEVTVNEAKVIQSDISASNGVIQVVDKVILPPDLKLQ
jgi:uncharacterized surface protein with fasciclin (FAS1) repeats